jgi:hypothetical protein
MGAPATDCRELSPPKGVIKGEKFNNREEGNVMKRVLYFAWIAAFVMGLTIPATAGEEHPMGGKTGKGIRGLSTQELIKLALSAAPPHIAKDAAVKAQSEDGKWVELKRGTNGFTCYPDTSGLSIPDPICNDPAAEQWFSDLLNGAPKPTNSVPGISYMARGGWHLEKDGKDVMEDGAGVHKVYEPPHWMVFWPFDSKESGIPAAVNGFGTYIHFEGTPYSHLMIHQNPAWAAKK